MIYKGFNSKFLKVTRTDRHLKKAEDDNGRSDGCIFFFVTSYFRKDTSGCTHKANKSKIFFLSGIFKQPS